VVVLDVRTPEEYIFVGHAPMARNIPVRVLNQELTAEKRRPVFEGDAIKEPQSYYNGKRVKNGWRNSGAPWTDRLNPNLMYHP
jgi:hypothetical protein